MTHPSLLIRPLVHLVAAAVLCPVAFAKPKSSPPKQAQTVKQTLPLKQAPLTKKPAITAAAPVTKKTAPARPQKPARQTQGDAPPQRQVPDHRSLIVEPSELLARVPASGPLTEEHLILLAIAKDPRLAARRAAIASAVAKRREQQDWENPELRLSYGSQDDDFIRDPYTERITETSTDEVEVTKGSDSLTSMAGRGETYYGDTIVDVKDLTTTTTNRYSVIERRVIPRSDGGEDVIDTIIKDSRDETTAGTRKRTTVTDDVVETREDAVAENITRGLKTGSTFTKSTAGPGGSNKQESFSALVRFQMPHPWQKKARVQRASAEIMLAEAQYLADEDKLVREVRDLFQTLGVMESTDSAQHKRRQNYTSLLAEMEGFGVPEFASDALRARLEMDKVYDDMRENESDIDRIRAGLAMLCGLKQTTRIRSGGLITRRVVDLTTLDPAYLAGMAMLYRADAVESRGRLEIAKAYLAEADAAKIPWATFIDAGWSRQWRDNHSGNEDEWMVRLGIEVPLFEWTGINKRSREYKTAAAKWELQLESQKDRVSAEVDLALERLRKSSASLRDYENNIRKSRKGISEGLTKVEAFAADQADFARSKRFKYDIEDRRQLQEIQRYRAFDDYNKALMTLENAVGIRIEKVLNGWRDK